jgi:hypothetical protein
VLYPHLKAHIRYKAIPPSPHKVIPPSPYPFPQTTTPSPCPFPQITTIWLTALTRSPPTHPTPHRHWHFIKHTKYQIHKQAPAPSIIPKTHPSAISHLKAHIRHKAIPPNLYPFPQTTTIWLTALTGSRPTQLLSPHKAIHPALIPFHKLQPYGSRL